MNIINIGILAHVDAGKTTLTESLLYASGTISEPGSVEKGTTRTDTMFLERQRGITIQTAVTSFQWHSCKVNIVDTPGHMDFLAEVYRSLAVLDGAILVLSAKDGVQAQTRVLFHALRKLNIPTIIFINKIDQVGIDLESVYQSVRDKLSADIIIKQTVSLSSKITLTENTSAEVWDSVIENNDELLAKYIAGESISQKELAQEEQRRVQDASLLPVYHGSAKNGLGIQQLMDAVIGLFQSTKEQGSAALCGRVFKVEYTDCGQRLVYLRLYSGTLRLRDTVALAGREKLKITEMRIPSKGEIVRTDTAHKGEIVILPSDSLRLNDILGDKTQLPREMWSDVPFPMSATGEYAELARTVLDEYYQGFQERNPNLRVFSAHLHMDEATPHIHIDFVPFTTGSKRGLDTRVSLKQALAAQGFKGGTRGATEWAQWVQSEKEQLAAVMERYDIQWEQKGTHEKHLSVLDYKKQEREKEIAALDSTLAEKQNELETVQNRIDNFDQGVQSIEKLEQRIESDAEFQLPDPPTLMTAKTYKQRFVDPLIKKLKEVIREVFYHYYKALDSYHRLNTTNGRLYRENEHLTATNDRLKGENDALRSELKDFRFLRKVLGSQQIDNLIAQAKDMEQQRKQNQRTRRRNTNYER